MGGERYRAEGFCIEENEAFRWFQGYEDAMPTFCANALKRMADEAPGVVRDKINEHPLGERLLSRLYFSGFPDDVMDELYPNEAPAEEVEVEPPVAFHMTVLPPVMPMDRLKPEREVRLQSNPMPPLTIRSLFSGQSDKLNQDDEWVKDAVCAETDPDAFFPEKGGSTREAKKVCEQCDVRAQCLESALENDERFGIWGGLSERERRKLKRRVV